jgi:hypothetical protein
MRISRRGFSGPAGVLLRSAAHLVAAALVVTAVVAVMGGAAAGASGSPAPARVKYYIVPAAGTTDLYQVAARTLGDSSRDVEIFDLNRGRLQPDGGRLEDPRVVHPGWILQLPWDAVGPGVHYGLLPTVVPPATVNRAPTATAPSAPPRHRPSRPAAGQARALPSKPARAGAHSAGAHSAGADGQANTPARTGADSQAKTVAGILIAVAAAGLALVFDRRRRAATAPRRERAPGPGAHGEPAPQAPWHEATALAGPVPQEAGELRDAGSSPLATQLLLAGAGVRTWASAEASSIREVRRTTNNNGAHIPVALAGQRFQPRTVQLGSAVLDRDDPDGDLPEELLNSKWWTDAMVRAAGLPVMDVPFLTAGGGIGSFVTVDYLRIAGVAPDRIRVLSNIDFPWQTYQYLTRVSQIPGPERIRSDSASRPDNIWGFPSYALGEAVREKTMRPVWQVLVEPVLADYFTPRVDQVLSGLRREAKRIGYDQMLVKGHVRMVRRRHNGGYFTVFTPLPGTAPAKWVVYRSEFVHLALGYAGLKFLPELQYFRTEHQDFYHVVNAYEDHEHVYELARAKHVVVMLRGGGVVASRILQRLMDDRARFGLSTQVVHLFRTYVDGSHGPNPWNRRKGGNGFAYQGFNYPKSVWGGQLKARMGKLEGDQLASAYQLIAGTNTPRRRRWQAQMREGRAGGWYRTISGTVEEMRLVDGKVVSQVKTPEGPVNVAADFVIDCTGLEADIAEHPVLADLLAYSGAGRNPLGRLDVERNFQLRGADSGPGVIYSSGAATLGGYFPGVDTFLGLQIAAQEITDDLARRGLCRRIGPLRSTTQWLRWILNWPP